MWFVFYLINTLLISGHKICFWAIYHWAFYHFMESNHFNSFRSIENGEINDFVNLASCCACVCECMAFIWLDLLSLKYSYICLYILSRARMCYRESWSFFFANIKVFFFGIGADRRSSYVVIILLFSIIFVCEINCVLNSVFICWSQRIFDFIIIIFRCFSHFQCTSLILNFNQWHWATPEKYVNSRNTVVIMSKFNTRLSQRDNWTMIFKFLLIPRML